MNVPSSRNDEDRVSALNALVEFTDTANKLQDRLKAFKFDSPPLVPMRASHVFQTLSRYLDGEITADDVHRWADMIEVREDIYYDGENADRLRDCVNELANPTLSGELTAESAKRILGNLERMPRR